MTERIECAPGYHDFEAPDRWGVVFGVSKCKRCGKVARPEDLRPLAETPKEQP